jgi:hypothetical protein
MRKDSQAAGKGGCGSVGIASSTFAESKFPLFTVSQCAFAVKL